MKSILLPTKQLKHSKTTDADDNVHNDTLNFKVDSRHSECSDVVVERARIDSDLVFYVDAEPNVALLETNKHNNKVYTASKKALTTTTAQVIRNCSVGASDKLKRVSSDISNSKSISSKYGDNDEQQQTTIKNNSNDYTITTVDVQHLNQTTENSPLLLLNGGLNFDNNDGTNAKQKFLNIKKNGATLIFQKKSSTQKYIKTVEYPELDNLKKRRSLQWSNSGSVGDKLKNRHSWYDSRFPVVIKEDLFDRSVS